MLVIASCSQPQKTLLICDRDGSENFYGTIDKMQYLVKTENCYYEGSMLIYCMKPWSEWDTLSYVIPGNVTKIVDSIVYVSQGYNIIRICGHYDHFEQGDSVWLKNLGIGSKYYQNHYVCIGDYKFRILE